MPTARTIHPLYGARRTSLVEARSWIGGRVVDTNGTGVGRLEDVWVDAATGDPAWLLIREGRFGGRHRLIPFEGAVGGGGQVWVPHERGIVRSAPGVGEDGILTGELGDRLREHYARSAKRAPAGA
jgi:sporulation protein YlmC with PRC-barrel domain